MDTPHDDKLEKTLIATLLAHPQAVTTVCSFLPPQAIYNAAFQAGYTGIYQLYQEHQPVSPSTVANALLELDAKNGTSLYLQSRGLEFLQELSQNGVEPAHAAPRLAETVRDHWLRRQEMDLAKEITESALNRGLSFEDRLTQARKKLSQIQGQTVNDGSTVSLKESLQVYLNILDENARRSKDESRLRLPWLGRYVPSLPEGTLVGVLGPAGGGKTSLMECISEFWVRQGWRGLYFHAEDSLVVKLHRRMARYTGIPFRLLLDDHLSSEQWQAALGVIKMIDNWPGLLEYIHCPNWTMGQIVAKVEQVMEAGQIDFVVWDYLNKINWQGDNKTQGLGQALEDYKSLIERYRIRGLVGAQEDKNAKKVKRVKRMSDARDTGEYEDKIQVGLIIDLQERPEGERMRNGKYYEACQIIVDKCNFGGTGAVDMRFIGARYLFQDVFGGGEG